MGVSFILMVFSLLSLQATAEGLRYDFRCLFDLFRPNLSFFLMGFAVYLSLFLLFSMAAFL